MTFQVKIKLFATLREIAGKSEIKIQVEQNTTVMDVIQQLSGQFGNKFRDHIFDKNTKQINSYLLFLINGESVHAKENFKTELKPGDTLAILPPVGGG